MHFQRVGRSDVEAGFSPDQAMVLLLDFAGKDNKKA